MSLGITNLLRGKSIEGQEVGMLHIFAVEVIMKLLEKFTLFRS